MSLFDKMIGASVAWVPKPIVRRIAAPYIAGESLDDQVATIKDVNAQGFNGLLHFFPSSLPRFSSGRMFFAFESMITLRLTPG